MQSETGKRPAYAGDSRAYVHGDAIDIKNLINIVRRRKTVLLWTICLGTGMVALTGQLITPRYTATSAVVIQSHQARVIDLKAVVDDLAPDEVTVETQIKLLTSHELAEHVVHELDLLSDPEFNPPLAEQTEGSPAIARWLPDAGDAARALLSQDSAWLHASRPTGEGVATELSPVAGQRPPAEDTGRVPAADPLEVVVAAFLKKLEVSRGGRSYVVSIDFTSTDPEKAARIANAVAQSYVQTQLADKLAATTQATSWLTERVEQLRNRVLESEHAVAKYRNANQLVDSEGTALNAQQLATVNATLIAARAERADKEARLEQVRQAIEGGGSYDAIAEVMASPLIVILREQETSLLRQKAQLSREYGKRHPRMLEVEAERQDLAAKIDREARNIVRTLEDEVMVARRREHALEESLAEAKDQSAVIGQAGIQLGELEREAAAKRTIYETFLTRLTETREQQDLLRPDARVISAAFVPEKPSFPNLRFMVVSGFGGSLMMGVLLAFLTEHLDRSLRTGRHLEELLGVTSLGLVPSVRRLRGRQKHHQYLLEKPLSEYAEAIRSVRKSLELWNIDRPPQVVMVTSTLPGEGKTTLATSLAASCASSGFETILVDLDLRHPSVAREVRQPIKADLIEFMTGNAPLEDIIHTLPSVDRLAYIPIKQLTRSPLNLLESQKMSSLLAELRARYDYVVLDTPPALGITDARTTALLADAVLLVVRWQQTKAEPAQRGLELLLESHARVAGAVLTQVNLRRLRKLAYGDSAAGYKSYKKYYQN
jgi:polysaccharide biosynthesis transport protein